MSARRAVCYTHARWCFSPASRPFFGRRYHPSAFQKSSPPPATQPRPLYVPPPTEKSGPLLWRRPDRELPDPEGPHIWLKTLPVFVAVIVAASLALINYQKSSSATVNSILYALRTNETSRQILGDEIYFRSRMPWISGTLNQLHGKIDISFWVKGTRGTGKVRFLSERRRRQDFFETLEWSLKTEDGKVIQLLDKENDRDPFQNKNDN